jgi:hypothetical protein
MQALPWHYGVTERQASMAVIDILIQPRGGTRILFDCRAKPQPDDEETIERAIARSLATASGEQLPASSLTAWLRPRRTAAPAAR